MDQTSHLQTEEKLEIAVIAAPQDVKYRELVVKALEGILQAFIRQRLVRIWYKEQIQPGAFTAKEMLERIQAARIILVLMSQDLLADAFYNDKKNHIEEIIRRSKLPGVQVIPLLTTASSWKHSAFKDLEPLPTNEIPWAHTSKRNMVLQDIAESVLVTVDNMLAETLVRTESESSSPPEEANGSSPLFAQGHALLIGTGGNLAVTIDDAQRLGRVLRHATRAAYPPAHVDILLDSNATRSKILTAFDRLIQRVKQKPDATVIVYFSGHGGKFLQEGQAPAYFLLPYGYDASRRHETAISDHELTARIKAIQAQKLVVFLDCCHAGGIPMLKDTNEEYFEDSSLPPELLQTLKAGGGRVVLASSRDKEKSQTDGRGSIFTNCLLEALRGKGSSQADHAIRILDVIAYLFREIPARTADQQHLFFNDATNMSENFIICYTHNQMKDDPDE